MSLRSMRVIRSIFTCVIFSRYKIVYTLLADMASLATSLLTTLLPKKISHNHLKPQNLLELLTSRTSLSLSSEVVMVKDANTMTFQEINGLKHRFLIRQEVQIVLYLFLIMCLLLVALMVEINLDQ